MPRKRTDARVKDSGKRYEPVVPRSPKTKRVYAQGVFVMSCDGTPVRGDDNQVILDHGPGNLPFDFPCTIRLHQLTSDEQMPKGWVAELDFHGTAFAIRVEEGSDVYKIFARHRVPKETSYKKVHEEPKGGTN